MSPATLERPDVAQVTHAAPEFIAWPKIPRLNRGMTITEKIDGTNACVIVMEDGRLYAQSRRRLIFPNGEVGDQIAREAGLVSHGDNAGFAAWVYAHADELRELGPGHHYGEWYGAGIQRTYGLEEKRFALFNTGRWRDGDRDYKRRPGLPNCVGVVPVLYEGQFDGAVVDGVVYSLALGGSLAVPGFDRPEGVVVFHHASRTTYKVLCEGDDLPKGAAA